MRLSDDRIKQGILHPKQRVRSAAVRYFSESFSADPTVMPRVIEAVERYGWRDAVSTNVLRDGLAQTDETLLWLLGELAREGDPGDHDWARYRDSLAGLLEGADAHLLSRYEAEIADTEGIKLEVRNAIAERIRLLSADPDTCWAELGEWCQRRWDEDYIDEVDLDEPGRLVEAIARHGDRYAARVLGTLQEEIEDFEGHPMRWMEPMVVRLAGEMKLEPAIPMLVEKLHEDGGLLLEECQDALARIGTDAVVEELCRDYADGHWSYRLGVAAVLDRIRSDLATAKCVELLDAEEDHDLRIWLGRAVLHQFSYDGIEPVRRLILEGPLHDELRGLQEALLAACTLMEVDFPEMDEWRPEVERWAEEHDKSLAEVLDDLSGEEDEYDSTDFDDYYDDQPLEAPEAEGAGEHIVEPLSREEPKVGRNDPCPCGSGKKFKKCCLRKEKNSMPFD